MDQAVLEKKLTISYIACAVLGAAASITTGVAWGHWKPTLDQCVNNVNCSCILYGQHTPSKFLGGSTAACAWVTFGPLFHVLFSLAFSCFHGYRVLFASTQARTRTIMTKDASGEMIEMHVQMGGTSTLPRLFWIVLASFTVFFSIYGLVHFSIFLDGFYQTCNQYRKTLENLLQIHGSAIPVIYRRLSCHAIFDFMDYMQQDSGNSYRDGFIFTGLDLILGIVASFFAWVTYAYAAFINITLARATE